MIKVITTVLVAGLISGCLIRTHPNHRHSARRSSASCPPSYHWNGGACVHNGRGHQKHKKHKHRH